MIVGFQAIELETNVISLPVEEKQPKNEVHSPTLNVLSLFSGCGGLDLGFEGGFTVFKSSINEKLSKHFIDSIDGDLIKLKKNRFQTIFANDILPDARKAWLNFFSKSKIQEDKRFHSESIVDLVSRHHAGEKVFPKNVDIVTGGFPCQDFSLAGKRNGFESHKDHHGKLITGDVANEHTRGKLYMWMKQVIEITKPNIFIAENVKGLVNLHNVKEIIQRDFSAAGDNGYIVLEPQVLHAATFGVPQSRERVIFIGIKRSALKKSALEQLTKEKISDKYNPYPSPTHSNKFSNENLLPFVKLKDLFKHLEEPETSRDLSHKYFSKAKFMGKHCQGQGEIKLEGIGPTIRAEHHGNIEFRRLSTEHGGKYLNELHDGKKERRLTPRECGLIQTFPSEYDFVISEPEGSKKKFRVSPSQSYKIIGNAVPPLLAYHIAKRLETVWDLYFKRKEALEPIR
jgi:DNA (cytosine-5)-methyltransferase 1